MRSTAEAGTDAGVSVVERVKTGVYSLHRLGSWVREAHVLGVGTGWDGASVPVDIGTAGGSGQYDTGEWWATAAVEDPVPDTTSMSAGPSLDIPLAFGAGTGTGTGNDVSMRDVPTEFVEKGQAALMSRLLPLERSSSFDGMLMQADEQRPDDAMVLDDNDAAGAIKPDAQSPQETLNALREQYLQALYISKVRLSSTDWAELTGRPLWRISPKDLSRGAGRRSTLRTPTPRRNWSSSTVMLFSLRRRWILSTVRRYPGRSATS